VICVFVDNGPGSGRNFDGLFAIERYAIIPIVRKSPKQPAEYLQELGLRRTPVRLSVLKILSQDGQPLSAAQVLERMPAGIDRVTLYRTLNTLTAGKLLHRVRGDDQIWRYGIGDPGKSPRHEHAHFVCDACGTVECLSGAAVPETSAKQSGIGPGYRVDYSEVLLHGTCPDCGR
jgi:Fur family transcriptional regulator, ferric uptake regulator